MSNALDMQHRLEALSPERRTLLARRLKRSNVDVSARPASDRLAVCLSLRPGALLNEGEVRAFARQRLPDYMVPQMTTIVTKLPRTPGGKLDRRALSLLEVKEVSQGAQGVVQPGTPAEITLAAIWCEVLNLDEVGIHDDFFEIGGDSLLSIRILSRASSAGLCLEPEAFFQHPTIAAQAALAGPTVLPAAEKPKIASEQPFPLANLDAGELDGISRMLADLDDDS